MAIRRGKRAAEHPASLQAERTEEMGGDAPPEKLQQYEHAKFKILAASYALGGQDLDALFRKVDTDGGGDLQFTEFNQACRSCVRACARACVSQCV